MYHVEIKSPCSCSIKRALPEKQVFNTKEEAQEEANRLLEQMQNEFCKKHQFRLKDEFGSFNIYKC